MENPINIGELDTLVDLQSGEQHIGDMGQTYFTYTTIAAVWAKVERNIDEAIVNSNYESGHSFRVTLYKHPQMTTRWRVKIDGKLYEIESIDLISRFSDLCTLTVTAI